MTPEQQQQIAWARLFLAPSSPAVALSVTGDEADDELEAQAQAFDQLSLMARSMAAGLTYGRGPNGPSVNGAPLPEPWENLSQYLDRAVGGDWHASGFNLGDPSTWGPEVQKLGHALTIVSNAFGLDAGQYVYLLSAVSGDASPHVLVEALKADWTRLQSSGALAQSVQNGDWKTAWNLATSDGAHLAELAHVWSPDAPPDADGHQPAHGGGSLASALGIPAPHHAPPKPKPKGKPVTLLALDASGRPSVGATIALAATPKTPANAAAIQRLAAASTGTHVSTALGLTPPPPTTNNPKGGRTILGIPVVDVGVGAVALAGAGLLARRMGWL